MRHLISPLDLSVEETEEILLLAEDIAKDPTRYSQVCKGKKIATLFYEPSTRTRLSFESAMLNLGGNVLGFSSADSSSAAKGESVADTIRVVSCYADIAAIRHPKEGAPYVASLHSSIPIINAGDGGPSASDTDTDRSFNHPCTQRQHQQSDHRPFAAILKFGRTVHSLITVERCVPGIRFALISPEELKLPTIHQN